MFYSSTENPMSHVSKAEEEEYLDKGFIKVEESAMCVVSKSNKTIFPIQTNVF